MADDGNDVITRVLGASAAQDFVKMASELGKHIEVLDALLMYPSPADDVRPRLTAASGLMAALDPYVDALARAGLSAHGAERTTLVELGEKHQARRAQLQRLIERAVETAGRPEHLFITGEYER